jgi:hypothetical protein
MATSTIITVNDTTPTLVFSGTGNVRFRSTTAVLCYGGSNVSAANGYRPSDELVLNLNSPDDIYAIGFTGAGNHNVMVFSSR